MRLISYSESRTKQIGKTIAPLLKGKDIVCIFGNLGSGKTIMAKGIASGLGIKESLVISPTFVIVREYQGKKFPLYHLDLYRLKLLEDALILGYEEFLYADAISVVEWPQRLKYLLPEEYLKIELSVMGSKKRSVCLSAKGERYRKLLRKIGMKLRLGMGIRRPQGS